MAPSRPSGIWLCWKPLGGRQCPQGHVPGSGRTGPRSHGRHLRVAGLAQSAHASAMGQRATQHRGAPGGPPDPPGWRPAAGDQLALPALAPPETVVDREEHSGGALRGALSRRTQEEDSGGALTGNTQGEHSGGGTQGSTQGEHSVGGLKRRTQEEHLEGTLRGSTQEGHSGGCPLSSPATLSWALRASLPASEFDGLAPFDRPQMDRACLALPGGPVIPLHNRDRLHHLRAWPEENQHFQGFLGCLPGLRGSGGAVRGDPPARSTDLRCPSPRFGLTVPVATASSCTAARPVPAPTLESPSREGPVQRAG